MEYVVYKSDIDSITKLASVFSSEMRVRMYILLLSERLSVTDLANRLGISPPTTSKHVARLEDAGVINVEYAHLDGANKKMCSAKYEKIGINFIGLWLPKKKV